MTEAPSPSMHRVALSGANVELHLYAPEPNAASSSKFSSTRAGRSTCLVLLPALGVSASYYVGFARQLAAAGFHVALADHRGGPGGSVKVKEGGDFGYGTLAADLLTVAADVRQRLPGADVIPLGHSLGAQVIVTCLNRHPDAFARVILVASSTPWVTGFPLRAALQIRFGAAMSNAARVLGYFPGALVGFGRDEAKTLMRDWRAFALRGTLPAHARNHTPPSAVGKRVLMLGVEGDWMTPPRAVDHLLSFLPGATIERALVGAADLEPRFRDHIRWLKQPDAFVTHVARWVASSSSSSSSSLSSSSSSA